MAWCWCLGPQYLWKGWQVRTVTYIFIIYYSWPIEHASLTFALTWMNSSLFLVLADSLPKLASRGVRYETFPLMTASLSSSPLTRRRRTLCSLRHASVSIRGSWHCVWATMSCTCGAGSQTPLRCSRWRHRPERRNRQSSRKGQSKKHIPKAEEFQWARHPRFSGTS